MTVKSLQLTLYLLAATLFAFGQINALASLKPPIRGWAIFGAILFFVAFTALGVIAILRPEFL